MDTTLLVGSLGDLTAAALFAYVGQRVARRHVSFDAYAANLAWGTWWTAIALLWTFDGLRGLAVVVGAADRLLPVFIALHYVGIAILCLALWGLLTYITFLRTGRHTGVLFGLLYGAGLAAALTAAALAQPDHLRAVNWMTFIEYAHPLAVPIEAAFFLLLLAPQIVGAAAYLLLARRAEGAARHRILLVGGALLAWVGINLVADLARWTDADAWQLSRRLLGIVASATIMQAYR